MNLNKQKIFAVVDNDLRIFPYPLLLKIVIIHLFVGTLTLLFCPQFNVSPLAGSMGLMPLFMAFGHRICAFLCGAFFLGSSAIGLHLFLKPGEALYLKHRRYRIYSGLAFGSLAVFIVLNELSLHSWDYTLIWLGACVFFASVLTSGMNYFSRKRSCSA